VWIIMALRVGRREDSRLAEPQSSPQGTINEAHRAIWTRLCLEAAQ
jgi:hypothetical protein